jgi:hypothetical protein
MWLFDDKLGLHRGASVPLPADSFDPVADTPPQVARHRGYESAFLDVEPMTVEVQA